MATIADCLKSSQTLAEVSPSSRLDVEILLAVALKKNRTYLYTWPEKKVTLEAYNLFQQYLQRRCQGEPIAYIIGEREFWSLPISVEKNVLIPRPETELLIESVLSLYKNDFGQAKTVVDLGTGTGAIAIALATECSQWIIYAVDKFATATTLAKKNCRRLQVENVTVVQSDWLAAFDQTVDLIVSNPPYVAADDKHLSEGDVRFEPKSALISEESGLADIRQVITQSYQQLSAGGWLLLEHGYNQAKAVFELLQDQGFSECFVKRDIGGHERVSGGRK